MSYHNVHYQDVFYNKWIPHVTRMARDILDNTVSEQLPDCLLHRWASEHVDDRQTVDLAFWQDPYL